MLIPLTLTTWLNAITSNFPPSTLNTGIWCRYSPGPIRATSLDGIPIFCACCRLQAYCVGLKRGKHDKYSDESQSRLLNRRQKRNPSAYTYDVCLLLLNMPHIEFLATYRPLNVFST